MPASIELHPLAGKELRKALHRYIRVGGLVPNRFKASFKIATERVSNRPQSCSPHLIGTRIAPIRKFPYWLVFIEKPHRIYLIAVMHSSRRPSYWRRRLTRP